MSQLIEKIYKKLNPRRFYNQYMLRIGVFSALSVATAYLIGISIPLYVDPTVAAILALVTIRPTLHEAVKEGFSQVAGTVVGAIIGLLIIDAFGFNIITLSLLVAASFVLAWVLKIGEEGAVAIGITLILINGPLFQNIEAIEGRLFGVIVGALVALFYSYWILPGKPHERALHSIVKQGKIVGALLKNMSQYLNNNQMTIDILNEKLRKIDDVMAKISSIKEDAKDAVDGSRWSPILKREEAEKVLQQVEMTEMVAMNVNSILLDLHRLFRLEIQIPESSRRDLSMLMKITAESITQQAQTAMLKPSAKISKYTKETLIDTKKKAANKLKNVDDTQSLILGGSMLSDLTKIRDILSE